MLKKVVLVTLIMLLTQTCSYSEVNEATTYSNYCSLTEICMYSSYWVFLVPKKIESSDQVGKDTHVSLSTCKRVDSKQMHLYTTHMLF